MSTPLPLRTQKRRRWLEILRKSPTYKITISGIAIEVAEGVFPPDKGAATQSLLEVIGGCKMGVALDMGCGTGILAIQMAQQGAISVHAVDIHPPAAACAARNIECMGYSDKIAVFECDLFADESLNKFYDFMVFNHPLYPGSGRRLFGPGEEGGKRIIRRFLTEAKPRLARDGLILMPFSTFVQNEHDPKPIAESLGFVTKLMHEKKDGLGRHMVYCFSQAD